MTRTHVDPRRCQRLFIGPLGRGSYDRDNACAHGEAGATIHGVAPGPHTVIVKGFGDDEVKDLLTTQIDVPADTIELGTFDLPPAP